jgi:hypothetical protein
MPGRPDFYRFVYRATREGQSGPGTHRHATGFRPVLAEALGGVWRRPDCGPSRSGGRSSGSRGVVSIPQRQISAGRRGIVGLVVCSMSPTGLIRRGL